MVQVVVEAQLEFEEFARQADAAAPAARLRPEHGDEVAPPSASPAAGQEFWVPQGTEDLPLARQAHRAIDRLMEAGHPIVLAFSSGKDSSVVVNLALTTAAVRVALQKPVPPILVIHSDTGVENPEVRRLADGELRKIRKYARDHGLPVITRVGQPLLYTSFPVRVISGRALPSFADNSRDCSVEWKVKVGRRLTKEAFDTLVGGSKAGDRLRAVAQEVDAHARPEGIRPPVVMTGVRKGESAVRNASIEARGETADVIWEDDEGRSYMSPIMNWSADDVFEYLGYAHAGVVPSYSSFEETLQFYRDAGGSSCAVVGDLKMAETAAKQKGGCGARSGCWTCVRIQKDESLQTMIASDPERYDYLRPLGAIRDFLANTQYDWTRRNFVGRTIDADGCVAIQADTYSPQMLEDLLLYCLSAQADENMAAMAARSEPRFRIVGPRELIAIDALWSLYGLHPPLHAIDLMLRVDRGERHYPPPTQPLARGPVPRLGKLWVGADWIDEIDQVAEPAGKSMRVRGLRSLGASILEGFSRFAEEEPQITRGRDGEVLPTHATDESFEVDADAAESFIGSGMAEDELRRFRRLAKTREVAWTEGVNLYLRMGMVMPAHGGLPRWHRIAKRTDWLQDRGLHGHVSVERLRDLLAAQQSGVLDVWATDADQEVAAQRYERAR